MNNAKMRAVIFNYLKNIGYPNIAPQVVFDSLPQIWRLLDSDALIPPGMTFKVFQDIIIHQYNEKLMQAHFESLVKDMENHQKKT